MKIENLERAYMLTNEIQIRKNWIAKLENRARLEFTWNGKRIPLSKNAKECLGNDLVADIEQDIRELESELEFLLNE